MSSLVRGHRWDLDRRCCCGSAPTSQTATRGADRRPAAQARSLPGLDPRDTAGQPWQPGRRKRWPGADTLSNNCLKIGLPLTRKCVSGGGRRGRRSQQGRGRRSAGFRGLAPPPGSEPSGVSNVWGWSRDGRIPELSERVSLRPPGQSKAPVALETVRPIGSCTLGWVTRPGPQFPLLLS